MGAKEDIKDHVCGVGLHRDSGWGRVKRLFGLGRKERAYGDDPLCTWFNTPISWKVGPITPDLGRDEIENIISDALQTWAAECSFSANLLPSTGSVDMHFGWYDKHDKTELKRATAFAYFPCARKPGDVYFNIEKSWDDDFLFKYALHEIGHAIGLQEDTYSPEDVMQTAPNQSLGILSQRDIDRANALYPQRRNDDIGIA